MAINPEIFRAYDVRGVYPGEINEEAAYLISMALVKFLKAKSIVLGHDMRVSSVPLYQASLRGLRESGVKIFDLDLCSTPMHTFVINREEADGGVMITASHNPSKYNGLKLSGKFGLTLNQESGLEKIKEMILSGGLEKNENKISESEIIKKDYLDEYVNFLFEKFSSENFSNFNIAIDAGNGMTGMILPKLLKKIKINYAPLYFELDANFPNHEANPIKTETLKDLADLVIKEKKDFGVAFDGDGDRVGFVDGLGEPININFIFSALIESVLKEKPGAKFIYGPSSSRIVRETIDGNGGKSLLCHPGHSFFREMMRKEKAYAGCELSGHCFFEEFFYADSGIFTMLCVLRLISRSGRKLEDLIAPFKKYFQSGEMNFDVENKEEILNNLEKKYSGAKISHFDGLTMEYPDWWFNIRKSNTEPLLRLNIEAGNPELLEEKKKEITETLNQAR